MIIREFPKMIMVSAERVQSGDIVRGRQLGTRGYDLYPDTDVFTVTVSRPMLATSGAWRIDGTEANGDRTWITAAWSDGILIEDRRKVARDEQR